MRCVIDCGDHVEPSRPSRVYEERITLWQAETFEEAIELAEAEVATYLMDRASFAGLSQAFKLFHPPGHGVEVYSLLRGSDLDADDYIEAFFDTGNEFNGHIDE